MSKHSNQPEHLVGCSVDFATERKMMSAILDQSSITLKELEKLIWFHEAVNYSELNHALIDVMSVAGDGDGEAIHPRESHSFGRVYAVNMGIALSFTQEMAIERRDQL